jgi:hypothetical protein
MQGRPVVHAASSGQYCGLPSDKRRNEIGNFAEHIWEVDNHPVRSYSPAPNLIISLGIRGRHSSPQFSYKQEQASLGFTPSNGKIAKNLYLRVKVRTLRLVVFPNVSLETRDATY